MEGIHPHQEETQEIWSYPLCLLFASRNIRRRVSTRPEYREKGPLPPSLPPESPFFCTSLFFRAVGWIQVARFNLRRRVRDERGKRKVSECRIYPSLYRNDRGNVDIENVEYFHALQKSFKGRVGNLANPSPKKEPDLYGTLIRYDGRPTGL